MHGLGSFIARRSRLHAFRVTMSLAAAVFLVGQARPDAAAGWTAPTIAYSLDLPGGQTAKVFSNGVAAVFSKDRRKVQFRSYPVIPQYDEAAGPTGLPDEAQLIADLAAGAKAPYADGRVLVVFASGVTGTSDVVSGRGAAFTNDSTTNAGLADLGVDHSERLFRTFDRGRPRGHARGYSGRPRRPTARLLQCVPPAPEWSLGPPGGDGAPPVARRGVRVS